MLLKEKLISRERIFIQINQ